MYHVLYRRQRSKRRKLWRTITSIVTWEQLFLCCCFVSFGYLLVLLGDGFPPHVWQDCVASLAGGGVAAFSYTFIALQSFLYAVAWLILLLVFLQNARPRYLPSLHWKSRERTSVIAAQQASRRATMVVQLLHIAVIASILTFLIGISLFDAWVWLPLLFVINTIGIITLLRFLSSVLVTLMVVVEEWYLLLHYY